jgi:hypothetical protein
MIAGLARDHDSGEAISKADVTAQRAGGPTLAAVTAPDGTYSIAHMPPGAYDVVAEFAGQKIRVEHVDVRDGKQAVVDITFTLGRPDAVSFAQGDPHEQAIDHYRPRGLAAGRIEGTISDARTHDRVAGAVVTASAGDVGVLQTVTDDQGRYRFDTVSPGTYSVSAYYSVGGRGQIEVRRSEIAVATGEAVVVPLSVEIKPPD